MFAYYEETIFHTFMQAFLCIYLEHCVMLNSRKWNEPC